MSATELTGYLLVVHGAGGELRVETLGEVGRAGGGEARKKSRRGEEGERDRVGDGEEKEGIRKATGSRPDKKDGLSIL